ncbi:MAG: hypothetical protein HRT57_16280 [Crocinitomicaceae bacterium]|nr:hypothetical protein [Crocinitomicaceae bacterium]
MKSTTEYDEIRYRVQNIICSIVGPTDTVTVMEREIINDLHANQQKVVKIITSVEILFSVYILDDEFNKFTTGNDLVIIVKSRTSEIFSAVTY